MKQHTTRTKKIRTQILLTPELVQTIDRARTLEHESRSAYLQKAALLRIARAKEQKVRLRRLADEVIGSVSLKKHPIWKGEAAVEHWRRAIRNEWE